MTQRQARCRRCGNQGKTRRDPIEFVCRTCLDGFRAVGTRAEHALRGGRWVQDGLIQRWVRNGEAA